MDTEKNDGMTIPTRDNSEKPKRRGRPPKKKVEAAPTPEPKPATGAKIKGKDLVPSVATLPTKKRYAYWVGVTASCPVQAIDCVVNFPKVNGVPVKEPGSRIKRLRGVLGAIVWLDAENIRIMRERIPRTVIRVINAEVPDVNDAGKDLEDVTEFADTKRPKAHIITIPTEERLKAAQEAGRPARRYIKQSGDIPAARFMFAQLCEDQVNPRHGSVYPEPLERTGLEFPEPIEE